MARWLLDKEARGDADPAGAAAERVWQKLAQPLSRLVSLGGAKAMLSRALHIARGEFPFLESVRDGIAPGAGFEGVGVDGVDVGVADAGLLAVLGSLLDLLAGFIGEDLTLRLLLEIWPDLPVREQILGQEAPS